MPAPSVVRMPQGVQVWSPAKVNLHLEVLGKRADGFHDLSTLIVPISLHDTLEMRDDPAGGISLECDEPALSSGPDNLVFRAAMMLRDALAPGRGARIRLMKRIPFEAGLGGGSGNAAATLLGLETLWGLRAGPGRLMEMAAALGSDVPCFLTEGATRCEGRGERVTGVPSGARFHMVVVKPREGLSTRDIFSRLRPGYGRESVEEAQGALAAGDVRRLGRALFNRLEEAACDALGCLAPLRAGMSAAGPVGVVMTGSGSAMVALADGAAHAAALGRDYRGLSTPAGPVSVFVVSTPA